MDTNIYTIKYNDNYYMIRHHANDLIIKSVKDPWVGIAGVYRLKNIAEFYCKSRRIDYKDRFLITCLKDKFIRIKVNLVPNSLTYANDRTAWVIKIIHREFTPYNYEFIETYLPHLMEDFNERFSKI